MVYQIRVTKDEIRACWDKRRPPKKLRAFVEQCLRVADWDQFAFIIRPGASQKTAKDSDFMALRGIGLRGAPMAWPYIAVYSQGDMMLARLAVEQMAGWDFRTGKRV